ncbi:MAG: ATP-binding protein [Eubacteriales bacterium]|nr:ATP-binding protein [Eubacteriales bacterium]
MYIERKADIILEKWFEDENRKPLIVKGARQIGKTETIRHFAGIHYKSLVEINFVKEPVYKTIISNGYSAAEIIKNISLIDTEKKFIPGKTLIFFDELQEFPEIATSLKFFMEDGRFNVICSGSLLGINYKRIESVSVGYKKDYVMRALDFEEFLWAKGYREHIDDLLEAMVKLVPLSETQMRIFGNLFLDFTVLGGMPAVIRQYLETGTFENSLAIQREIQADYEEDIRKYADGVDQTRILNVYRRIVPQLGKENKKFQISKVASGARFKDYFGCIEWLLDAGIINRCYCLNYPELPLKGNIIEDKYKLYMADTGLLISMLDDEEQMDLRANKNLGTYKGALYENLIAEALVKQGYDLFYYQKENSQLEEDFFIRTMKDLIPIEVKAGSTRSKALSTLIKSDAYPEISYGIKFSGGNIGFHNQIYTFPQFCAFLLRRYIDKLQDLDRF